MMTPARTLVEGLALDLAIAVGLAIGPLIASADFAFTREYWAALGIVAFKSASTAGIQWLARRKTGTS